MRQYLQIVDNVLYNGWCKSNRTGIPCLTTFCEIFRHNMCDGFPLLTTKKMYLKGILVELEGFIKGITSKQWYQERGCNIWNQWSNPLSNSPDDLGPIYGYQWRHFNLGYDEDDFGTLEEHDQLQHIVDTLKNNPNDRRMICSAWNPQQINRMALPPCHFCFGLTHILGRINLYWVQRSCDLMLGVPFNIASYATLLLLLCKETGLVPGELVGVLADCHIYTNQTSGAEQQLTRAPQKLPKLEITTGHSNDHFNIFEWTHKDVELIDYNPHPKIDFGPVAI